MTAPPAQPRIYHIVHVDRLPSIIAAGGLLSDAMVRQRNLSGTTIGIGSIKAYRLQRPLKSHPGLRVGECVPFYFCPRSVMLFILHKGNHPELTYTGGQEPIVHLELDLHRVAQWANANGTRWAITDANAGTSYFRDWNDLKMLEELNWQAINARIWRDVMEAKQAEFLVEEHVPWRLVGRIGVISPQIYQRVHAALAGAAHRPAVQIRPDWYY